MCNVKKFEKIYQEIEQLEPEDTLQLMLEADTEEQREFYQMVGDFLLQKKQKKVIGGERRETGTALIAFCNYTAVDAW